MTGDNKLRLSDLTKNSEKSYAKEEIRISFGNTQHKEISDIQLIVQNTTIDDNQLDSSKKPIEVSSYIKKEKEEDKIPERESSSYKEKEESQREVVKNDIAEKYLESQLNLQKNMEKYEEVINLNLELKKEKDEVRINPLYIFMKLNV